MQLISSLIIPTIVLVVIVHGLINQVNIFDSFIKGVKEGFKMTLDIFPTILAMIISINVLLKSNIIIDLTHVLSPLFKVLNIPSDIIPLALMRPISGSSSLIIMNNILMTLGPDSYIGRVASVIQGSTDTTIYIIGLYFSSVGIKKIKYALSVGLLADLSCIIIALIMVSLFF